MKMRQFATTLLIPFAFGSVTACGDGSLTDSINLEEATYLSALEGEDLGSDEGDTGEASAEGPTMEEGQQPPEAPFACSFDQIRDRIRERFDRDGDGELGPTEQEEMSSHFDDGEEEGEAAQGELDRPRRPRGPRGHGPEGDRPEGDRVEGDRVEGDRPEGEGRPDARRPRHHKLKRLRWIYDTDSSGSLDEEERAVLQADLEARCENIRATMLENFDADEDGSLSEEERQAAHDARRENHQQRREDRRTNADTDDDGEVSREERQAAHAAHRENRQERRGDLKALFDTDEDGVLSDDEKAALREYLREWVRGEHIGEGRPGSEPTE